MLIGTLPAVLIAAFGAGFVDAMVGGGGLTMVPALFAALPRKLPAAVLGTGKVASICGTATAVARYARSVRIQWRLLLPAAAAARLLKLATNGAALLLFASRVELLWLYGLLMAVCNVAGSLLGTRLALKQGAKFVRLVFLAVVGTLIAKTAWDAVSG